MNFVIYTSQKNPDCPYCIKAKNLLKEKNIEYQEKIIGRDISREDWFAKYGAHMKTVPQIFIDGQLIGGYESLVEYFETPVKST